MEARPLDARDATGIVRAIAAYGLPGAGAALPREPLDDVAFAELLAHARDGRIPALLARAAANGALPLTDAQAEDVDALAGAAAAFVAVLEDTLVGIGSTLERAGVVTRVLKGAALAHLDYPDPSWRTYGDVDLLVRGVDLDRAVATLAGVGYARRLPELRPGFDRRFAKGVPMTNTRLPAVEVDVHRVFADGPFGVTSRPDELFEASQPFAVRDDVVHALSAPDRLVHACFHVALSAHVRLSSVRDVAQLVLVTRPEPDAVLARASRWRAEPVVARGITVSWRVLGLDRAVDDALVSWAHSYATDARSSRALAVSVGPEAGWPAKARATARTLGWADRVAYVRAVMWPTREFLDARGLTRRARWRRAIGGLRPGQRG